MTVLLKRLLLPAIALLGAAYVSRADVPNGLVSFSVDTNSPVYDLTGSLQFDGTITGSGSTNQLLYGINVIQDSRGRITGSGTTQVLVGNDFVAAEYTVQGRISASHGSTRVTLVVRLKGEDAFGGVSTPFSINIEYKLTINPDSGTMDGSARGSAKFGQLGSGKIRSDISVPLPAGTDGSWTLQMNIVTFSRLGGSAIIVLSNGRTLTLNLNGRYSSSLDESTVKMSGTGDSRGNNVTVTFVTSPENSELLTLRGTVLGQTVKQ